MEVPAKAQSHGEGGLQHATLLATRRHRPGGTGGRWCQPSVNRPDGDGTGGGDRRTVTDGDGCLQAGDDGAVLNFWQKWVDNTT